MRIRVLVSALLCGVTLVVNGARLGAQGTATICKDGTTSAASGRGACSGHGGVDEKATAAAKKGAKAAAKAEKAEAKKAAKSAPSLPASVPATSPARTKSEAKSKAPSATKSADVDNNDPKNATAQCKDGTYSHAASHQGACSRHGGVSKFLKP